MSAKEFTLSFVITGDHAQQQMIIDRIEDVLVDPRVSRYVYQARELEP